MLGARGIALGVLLIAQSVGGCAATSDENRSTGTAAGTGTSTGGTGSVGSGSGGGWHGGSDTCEQAAQTKDYIGCDFYPNVHPNVVKSYFDYAVVVANAGANVAHVVIERGGMAVAEGDVAPGGLTKFFLPWVGELKHYTYMCDTDISQQPPPLDQSARVPSGAYHLTSTFPVTVYQFNPLQYKEGGGPPGKSWVGCAECWPGCNSYSNDASLLLPSTALSGSYVVPAMSGIDTPDIHSPAYIHVTGLHDGTNVNVKVGADGRVVAGGGLSETGPGQILSFPIARGEVVRLLGTPDTDLGGTMVQADKPVQVMTGMPHTYIPFDRQSSDHIEEVVFPVETLGKHYLVARPTGPNGVAVGQVVRLFGVVGGTTLTYPAGSPAGAPTQLNAGSMHDLGVVEQDFEVIGDREFEVATFQLGQTLVDPQPFGRGDPSQSTPASLEQYRSTYVFLAPDDYDVSFADVVMPLNATLTLDGAPVSASPALIGSGHGIARIQLGPGMGGAHRLVADQPVGLQVMGYGFATSYQYPGGLDLRGIAPPLPPLK
jgi:hypothetical protein